ncbi:MAG: phage portal protein [Planctomycetota bacterium]|jgi:hypothetical protein
MAFDLTNFQDPDLDTQYLSYLVDRQGPESAASLERLWNYFLNPLTPATGTAPYSLNANSRPYFQAQETGLPPRITGTPNLYAPDGQLTDLRRKEVVVENDIAWRLHTMIDFLFGKGLSIRSLATDGKLASAIEHVLAAMLKENGGIRFLQEMALLGAVYGFVDIALRAPAGRPAASPPLPRSTARASVPESGSKVRRPGMSQDNPASPNAGEENGQEDPKSDRSRIPVERAVALARELHLETVEAARVLPILHEDNYRRIRYWVQRYEKHPPRLAEPKRSWLSFNRRRRNTAAPSVVEVVEILGLTWWQRYEDRELIAEGPNVLGRLPVVHIQNIALPGSYAGISDVEPLIPLQDELNTRLSDRANRVTFQSFKMYLGKGIDDFLERPVAPGQMWATQNLDAEIAEFGSDTGSPSEDAHIEQIRQAMDKVSGVTPLAAGLIRGNVGNLTSATALKVVLSGLLAKTAKKRLTYGAGLQQMFELSLQWLDLVGALKTKPEDRQVELTWPTVLPVDEAEQLRNAQVKAQLGVSSQQILAELGYPDQTTTVR